MKHQFLVKCALLLMMLFGVMANARSGFAQVGTQKWKFQNRGQVRSAVLGNLKNLRASYEIVTCAAQQGMIRTALQTYEGVIGKDIYNASPEVCSSYALAHHYIADPSPWNWKRDTDQSIQVVGATGGLQVKWFRERALSLKPQSPEVLLSYALWGIYNGKRPLALNQINEVVRRAPKWADAHYWRANIIGMRWSVLPTSTGERQKAAKHYGTSMLRALDRAQKLDPGFRKEIPIDRYHAFLMLGDYKRALVAYDAYGAANKGFAAAMDGFHGIGHHAQQRQYLAKKARGS